tara:strand:+ start:24172 stop:24771 length:600 start_codon:yes stop_codon:yes gene_type:complete
MDFITLIKDGGFIMVPLLICSLIIWTVAIERWWFLRSIDEQFNRILEKSVELIKENKLHEVTGLAHGVHPVVSKPFSSIFEGKEKDFSSWQIVLDRRLSESASHMRKFLWLLGTIGTSAPFIGLFGTVVGIIKSFESISTSGKSGFTVVAAGLSEALIATASGIIVAVFAVILYNYFQVRLREINIKFRNSLEDLRELL